MHRVQQCIRIHSAPCGHDSSVQTPSLVYRHNSWQNLANTLYSCNAEATWRALPCPPPSPFPLSGVQVEGSVACAAAKVSVK